MHDEFLVLIDAINELLQMQKHATQTYYSEFIQKVNYWYDGMVDERAIRDMMMG